MKKLLVMTLISFLTVIVSCTPEKNEISTNQAGATHEDPEGYYTCPMHPEVHEHKSGACPICGMALVKVSGKKESENKAVDSEITFTGKQMQLAATSKYTVIRKNLKFTIPLAGRLLSSREVSFQVYESDVGVLKNGMEFKGTLSSALEEILTGKIRHIEHLIDPSTRTISIMGLLDKTSPRAIVDSSFYGEVEVALSDQIAVPQEAVFHAGERDLVYVFTDDKSLQSRLVIVGKKAGDEYQIISGLNENEVISSGANFLIDSEAKIRGKNDKEHH
ncbi:hypothetical protein K2X05_03750 [bacterium]|nr:hypothetical protein [bacterium]